MDTFLLNSKVTSDSDGNVLSELFYVYDENYNLIDIREPETPSDGASFPSSSDTEYIYDDNNNLIREINTFVSGFNGFITGSTTEYTYDNNNLITESFDSYLGSTPDGIERLTTYVYDDNNLTTETTESYVDGVLDNTSIIAYLYDDNNLITETIDNNNDGIIDGIVTYAYDSTNNLIDRSEDLNNDGIIDIVTTYTYDSDNNLLSKSIDNNNDNNPDRITNYLYNAGNNLIAESIDEDGNGEIDTTIEYDYIQLDEFGNEVIAQPNLSLIEVHRFYQYERDFHFYTSDLNEISSVQEESDVGELFYEYEGEQYRALADDKDTVTGVEIEEAIPVYRFFNTDTGAHLYTTDEIEKNFIIDNLANYNFEGIKYYAFESEQEDLETIPMYRLLNNSSGTHLLSSDTNEIDYISNNLSNFALENNGDAVFHVFKL